MNIDKTEFEQWLRNQESTAYVGMSCNSGMCPVSTWLRESQQKATEVGDEIILVYQSKLQILGEEFETPEWVKKFIRLVDQPKVEVPVIAAEALLYLEAL